VRYGKQRYNSTFSVKPHVIAVLSCPEYGIFHQDETCKQGERGLDGLKAALRPLNYPEGNIVASLPTRQHSTMPLGIAFALLNTIVGLPLIIRLTAADDIPISDFPKYTQNSYVAGQVEYCSSKQSVSFGCADSNPATCLCDDPLSSLRIRGCVISRVETWTDAAWGTSFWADYCYTNAGIDAHDETLIQDLSVYTMATAMVGYCASIITSTWELKNDCTMYTVASCLCASSTAISSSIQQCISDGGYTEKEVYESGKVLWQNYCDANSKSPAVRSVITPFPAATGT
jgi:hypothetical protein